jgi:hypothetical protein
MLPIASSGASPLSTPSTLALVNLADTSPPHDFCHYCRSGTHERPWSC